MTPTADCLIIYNAQCRLCESFYNYSLWERGCEESQVEIIMTSFGKRHLFAGCICSFEDDVHGAFPLRWHVLLLLKSTGWILDLLMETNGSQDHIVRCLSAVKEKSIFTITWLMWFIYMSNRLCNLNTFWVRQASSCFEAHRGKSSCLFDSSWYFSNQQEFSYLCVDVKCVSVGWISWPEEWIKDKILTCYFSFQPTDLRTANIWDGMTARH